METLDAVFEIQDNLPVPVTPPKKPVPYVYDDENALIEDLKSSRADFDTVIEQGQTALVEVLSIATQGQHPRFYEAAAMLIKSITEANKERMDIHVKLNEIRQKQSLLGSGGKGPTVNVDKAMFFGTTEELQAMMKKKVVELEHGSTTNQS